MILEWHGIKIAENRWLPPKSLGIIDGQVFHGIGLAWVNTMPPCFLDVEAGELRELPQGIVDALVKLLSSPPKPKDPPWMLPLSLRPPTPSDDFRFRWPPE